MAGNFSNVSGLATFTGNEAFLADTETASGSQPQAGTITLAQLATQAAYYSASTSKTTVAGTRYTIGWVLGAAPATEGVVNLVQGKSLTGIAVLQGSVAGTDKWIAELHDSAGNLLATSATAGVSTTTASTWLQLPFTAAYNAAPGQYYICIQSNGTTDHPAVYSSPAMPYVTGSSTGSFGTGAAITPPTTYTANLGPVVTPYT